VTHYDVLGVPRGAADEDVRRAYLEMARRHHPDVHATDDTTARLEHAARMTAVNEAWHVLGDPVRRRHYDEELDAEAELDGAGPDDLRLGLFDFDPSELADVDDPEDAEGAAFRRPLAILPALLLVLAALLLGAALLLRSAAVGVVAGVVGVAGATLFALFPLFVMARAGGGSRE
jgi:hypothetical protein